MIYEVDINEETDKGKMLLTLLKELNYTVLPKKKPSDYFGMLSKEKGEEMLKYVNESRDEFDERNI